MSEPLQPATPGTSGNHDALAAAAAAARLGLQGNRSDRLLRLFDFLVERTLADQPPTEQQIAAEAFGITRVTDSGQDGNVRVYVHRLRKALDAVGADAAGRRLQIPLGEYRVRLVEAAAPAALSSAQPGTPAPAVAQFRPGWRGLGAALLALTLLALAWQLLTREPAPLSQTAVWRDFTASERPLVIVAGDYYLFARRAGPATNAEPQLVWDQSVPTREDLNIFQMLEPDHADEVVDLDQQFLSAGTVNALSSLRASIASLPSLRRKPLKLVAASQLTPDMLGSADILYVGQLSGLPALLRDPLSQASGFHIEPGFGGLTDLASRQHYQSDGMVLTDERIPRRDYAYLASFPGPGGNRLMAIAGLGEAGLKQAARIIGDPAQLRHIGRTIAESPQGFELLERVRTIRDVNVGATPVLARPLRTAAIWDNPGNVAPYRPLDEPSQGGRASGRQ